MHLTPLEYILIVSTLLEINPLSQAIKTVRTKSVQDVSPLTFLFIFTIGGLWLFYGITISNVPLIIGNSIKLLTSLAVLLIYSMYKRAG